MNLFIELETTPDLKLQLRDGSAPQTADAAPTYRIYGSADTPVATGTLSGVIDSQTGWHKLGQAFTAAAGFARGTFTMRVAYAVSTVAKVLDYSIVVY